MTKSTSEINSDDDETTGSKLEKSGSQHSLNLSFESSSDEENKKESDDQALMNYPALEDQTLNTLFATLRNNPSLEEALEDNNNISQYNTSENPEDSKEAENQNENTEYSSFILYTNDNEGTSTILFNSPWNSFVGRLGAQQLEEERFEQEANLNALITYPVPDTTLENFFENLRNNNSEQGTSQSSFYDLLFNFNNLSFAAMAIIIGVVYELYFHNEGC